MAIGTVKLSYNGALFRVRLSFSRQDCLDTEDAPLAMLQRAKAKLHSLKKKGDISFYLTYEERLATTWKAFREAEDKPPEARLEMTIAAGCPELFFLSIEKGSNDKAFCLLSVDGTVEEVEKARFEWVRLYVSKKISELGLQGKVNHSQIRGALLRASVGEKVQRLAISALPVPQDDGKPFAVVANKGRLEVAVLIKDAAEVAKDETMERLLRVVRQAAKQLSKLSDGIPFTLLKKDLLTALERSTKGPEMLGLELPMAVLVAAGVNKPKNAGSKTKNAAKQKKQQKPTTSSVLGEQYRIHLEIPDDKMEATIVNFNASLYDDPKFDVTLDWIASELKRHKISAQMDSEIAKDLGESIVRQESLNGLMAVQGIAGEGGKGPYLHPSYKDAATRVKGNLDEDSLDIREMQQRKTVSAGQLVAEIKYNIPPQRGVDIYGQNQKSPDNDELIIRVGDGIQQRKPGKYYAVADGIPEVDTESIALNKVLVHEGDVNLRSGNIRFDGPAEIKGSIDSGAVVEITGDLIVHGNIRGGHVFTGGNVEALAGIVTGENGYVRARGDIIADFIENSNITCGGNLIVQKAVLNSKVIVGAEILLKASDGVIAGGAISCRGSLRTSSLGFKNGAVTKLNVGVDWKAELAVRIRQGRIDKVTKKQIEDRQALRELVSKKAAQLTQRHQEMKQHYQDRLAKERKLIEKLQAHLSEAQSRQTFDADSIAYVNDKLAGNVDATIGGQRVPIPNEFIGVMLTAKRKRGSHISPILNRKDAKGDVGNDKKAS